MRVVHTGPIPIELWGKDHWSAFAYLEHCCVDDRGRVAPSRMREDPAASPPRGNRQRSGDYPTRLNDGTLASPHDDWSCIDDFVSFDLVEWPGTGANPVFVLTARGHAVAAALRRHKAAGGMFHGFRIEMAGALPPIREGSARDRVPVRTITITQAPSP